VYDTAIIGRITIAGSVTAHPRPDDGNLSFTEGEGSRIGYFTP
jgi:hypothetical protein